MGVVQVDKYTMYVCEARTPAQREELHQTITMSKPKAKKLKIDVASSEALVDDVTQVKAAVTHLSSSCSSVLTAWPSGKIILIAYLKDAILYIRH